MFVNFGRYLQVRPYSVLAEFLAVYFGVGMLRAFGSKLTFILF